jgi:hypothetical protein
MRLSSSKNSKKNLDSYYLVTFFYFLSLKNDVNVPLKSNKQKNFKTKLVFVAGSKSGSISQRHGSADPDPHQNVMDPQNCY